MCGIGLKIFGIEGTKLLEDEPDSGTFDYAMINYPIFFANTVEHYIFVLKIGAKAGAPPPSTEVGATRYLERGEVMRWRRDDDGCSRAAESAEVWDRWQRGEGLKLIGRVFDRSSGAIFQHLKPHGGIRPVPRRRSRRVAESG